MKQTVRRAGLLAVLGLLAAGLISCGGGGSPTFPSVPPTAPTLALTLSAGRLNLECSDTTLIVSSLVSPAGAAHSLNKACGTGISIATDEAPGPWTATWNAGAASQTMLPTLSSATVFIAGKSATIGRLPIRKLLAGDRLELEATDSASGITATIDITGTRQVLWEKNAATSLRLVLHTAKGVKLSSQPFAPVTLKVAQRLSGWAPMVLLNDEVGMAPLDWLDSRFGPGTSARLGYGAPWFQNREARDVRVADFDGDGSEDFIANSYGKGCVMLGLAIGSAPTVLTPLGADGVCYGGPTGFGETIVLLDVENDGLVDIFLPFYARNLLLRNTGGAHFQQIVGDNDDLAWPNAFAPIEGAAAVDVNFDGWTDIVAGSTVFTNNRRGSFRANTLPARKPDRDEGLATADFDGDGIFDVAVLDPTGSIAVYWGRADGGYEPPKAVIFGHNSGSNGIAAGFLTGKTGMDLVVAGGSRPGAEPVICIPDGDRTFTCASSGISATGLTQDLVQIGALSGSAPIGLIARFGYNNGTGELHFAAVQRAAPRYSYAIELVDPQGRRTLYGRSMRLSCKDSGEPLGAYFIDGGNGFLAQGKYAVSLEVDCGKLRIDYAGAQGIETYDALPGPNKLRVKH